MKVPFAKHTWLGFIRSPTLTKKIIEGVIIGFFALYTAISLLGLGLAAPTLIGKYIPGISPFEVVAGGLCAYIFIDILTRYFIQKFPSMSIKPYLLLPIKRSRIVNYMLFRALLSPFNLIIPFFLVPFLFSVEIPEQGNLMAWGLVILALSTILIANYASFAITAFAGANKKWAIGLLAAIVSLIYLEVNGVTHLMTYLYGAGGVLVSTPLLWAIPIAVATGVILWLKRSFNKEISYYENTNTSSSSGYLSVNGIFSRFGKFGILMDMELSLIIRSKRARSFALASLAYCLLPFLLRGKEETSAVSIAFFAFIITGGFALNYGQLMLSWNSMHFDLLLSRGYRIKDIFTAKFYLLIIFCAITFFITLPYVFMFPEFPLISLAMTLWNMSFSIYGYMILASVNSLRIDPNEGSMFNYSGFGLSHYLIAIPIMGIPFVIYGLGWLLGGSTGALLLVSGLSIVGLLLHKKIISICVSIFKRNRYSISKAFRTK